MSFSNVWLVNALDRNLFIKVSQYSEYELDHLQIMITLSSLTSRVLSPPTGSFIAFGIMIDNGDVEAMEKRNDIESEVKRRESNGWQL